MKRPRHVWFLFALCLGVVTIALLWLTGKTVQLDHERSENLRYTEIARRDAQLQERISSALWRLDWMLTPLVAREAALPYFVYQPFYQVGDRGSAQEPTGVKTKKSKRKSMDSPSSRPSPLMVKNSPYVRLHFQISAGNEFVSPRCPPENMIAAAYACGFSEAARTAGCRELNKARKFCGYKQLIARCSPNALPTITADGSGQSVGYNYFGSSLNIDVFRDPESKPAPPTASSGDQQTTQGQSIAELQQHDERRGQANGGQEAQRTEVQGESQAIPRSPNPQQQPAQQVISQQFEPPEELSEGLPRQKAAPDNVAVQQRAWNKSRAQSELQKRNLATNAFALNQLQQSVKQWMEQGSFSRDRSVREGVMRPIWIKDKLLLVRKVDVNSEQIIQCCWLDWQRLEHDLLTEIKDILPAASLRPIREGATAHAGRALATLPIEIVATWDNLPQASLNDEPLRKQASWYSEVHLSLLAAWLGLAIGGFAIGLLLHGVIKLSERRGAFVSAVTHELRTPLTTFRMYAEMLAEKMLPTEQKRQEYANTLRVEADRLSHLVENVLQFARLERGCRGGHQETLNVGELLGRFQKRLIDRAAECQMDLQTELTENVAKWRLTTEPVAVEHILFNLVDNACKYARDAEERQIVLECGIHDSRPNGKEIRFSVRDFGPGVQPQQVAHLFRPFHQSHRDETNSTAGVGLGLALSRKLAGDLGGDLIFVPTTEQGALFVLILPSQ